MYSNMKTVRMKPSLSAYLLHSSLYLKKERRLEDIQTEKVLYLCKFVMFSSAELVVFQCMLYPYSGICNWNNTHLLLYFSWYYSMRICNNSLLLLPNLSLVKCETDIFFSNIISFSIAVYDSKNMLTTYCYIYNSDVMKAIIAQKLAQYLLHRTYWPITPT